MAKPMARINASGVVTNMEWCSESALESETLKNLGDRPVGIGDAYENGKFYRDGVQILTPLEEAEKRIAELEAIDADKTAALHELGVFV